MSEAPVRHIRLRAVVAYPAVALLAAFTLALSPFDPGQGLALAALATPSDASTTAAAAPTETTPTTVAPPTETSTTAAATTTETRATTAAPTADAPTTDAATTAAPTTAAPTTAPVPRPTPGLAPNLAAAPADHYILARIGDSDFQASYLTVDELASDASQFQTFRVRFQLHNDGTDPLTTTPQLEFRAVGAPDFVIVPVKPTLDIAVHLDREWAPSPGGGTKEGSLEEDISAADDFKLPPQVGQTAVPGHRSMGANPAASITLQPASFTEQEFTVGLSMDAKYLTGYELRITNGGTEVIGGAIATIALGPSPKLQLSPFQRDGVTVVDPAATNPAGVVYPLMSLPTTAANALPVATIPAGGPASTALYPLASGSLSSAVVGADIPVLESSNTHGQCAACHRGHTAEAPDLTKDRQQSTLCFSCHDSTGTGTDVKSQYLLTRPSNDADARDYYSHDAVDTSASGKHTSDLNEFEGVSNRHSECADCHNSHKVGSTDSTQLVDGTGWNASGRLAGVTGVAVTNGPIADSTPTYNLLDGVIEPVTREYELCFKCHSGYTKLLPPVVGKPSKDALDKGIEFNPANNSFHPVEAKGKNSSAKMTDSLAGQSPYKLWNFNIGSTIRCLNCHASGSTPEATPLPAPGSALQPHTSSNRGILLKNYKDRELKATDAAYSAGDFALCYMCHAEAPFANKSDPASGNSNATNFKLHGLHLTGLAGKGAGGKDIDTAGDGQGNATCAECHFRIHSTTNKVGAQVTDDSRLVNFAPNVTASDGAISWDRTSGVVGAGTCTLTCHGYAHKAGPYDSSTSAP